MTFLNIANQALGALGKTPLTAAQLDTGIEEHHLIIRNRFALLYRKLVNTKPEEFRRELDITTAAEQNSYILTVGTANLLSLENVRLVDETNPENSFFISYLTERQAEALYPNPNAIPLAENQYQIKNFFIDQTASAGLKVIRFINKPNAEYKIRFDVSEPPTSLTANQATQCTQEGDDYLIFELMASITRLEELYDDAADYIDKAATAWLKYSAQEYNDNINGGAIDLVQLW